MAGTQTANPIGGCERNTGSDIQIRKERGDALPCTMSLCFLVSLSPFSPSSSPVTPSVRPPKRSLQTKGSKSLRQAKKPRLSTNAPASVEPEEPASPAVQEAQSNVRRSSRIANKARPDHVVLPSFEEFQGLDTVQEEPESPAAQEAQNNVRRSSRIANKARPDHVVLPSFEEFQGLDSVQEEPESDDDFFDNEVDRVQEAPKSDDGNLFDDADNDDEDIIMSEPTTDDNGLTPVGPQPRHAHTIDGRSMLERLAKEMAHESFLRVWRNVDQRLPHAQRSTMSQAEDVLLSTLSPHKGREETWHG